MRLLAIMGTSLVFPFMTLYVRELGVLGEKAVTRWSGAAFSAAALASAIFSPIWGSVGDKYGRKLMILRANFGMAITITLMGLVKKVYQLVALRFLFGSLGGLLPASLALVSTCVPKDRMGYALGLVQTANFGGAIIAPLIGGALADLLGFRKVFFVTGALIFVGGLACGPFLLETPLDRSEPRQSGVLRNVTFVASNPALLSIALCLLLVNFAMMVLQPIFPLYVERLGAPRDALATTVGIIFSLAGFAVIASAPFWGKQTDKRGSRPTLIACLSGSGIFYALQSLAQTIYQLAPLRVLMGLFNGGVQPSTQAIVVHNSPESRRGGVIGITTSAGLIGSFLGPLTGGFLAAVIGMRALFVFTGATLLATALLIRRIGHGR